jgi:hypothetical protein
MIQDYETSPEHGMAKITPPCAKKTALARNLANLAQTREYQSGDLMEV